MITPCGGGGSVVGRTLCGGVRRILFAQRQRDGLHLAVAGNGDGKGVTGRVLLHQGAKVVFLGDLGAVDADDTVPGLQTGLVGGAALQAGPPCTTSTT